VNNIKNIVFAVVFCSIFLQSCEKEYSSIFDPTQNVPPIVKNVQAPDTLIVPLSDTLKISLSVEAIDADGQSDILSVFFNTFRPDGSPSANNPFLMFDDGNIVGNGDLVKGDGIFSRIIILPPGTTKGKYRFDFQAIDKSNEISNVISHFMVLK